MDRASAQSGAAVTTFAVLIAVQSSAPLTVCRAKATPRADSVSRTRPCGCGPAFARAFAPRCQTDASLPVSRCKATPPSPDRHQTDKHRQRHTATRPDVVWCHARRSLARVDRRTDRQTEHTAGERVWCGVVWCHALDGAFAHVVDLPDHGRVPHPPVLVVHLNPRKGDNKHNKYKVVNGTNDETLPGPCSSPGPKKDVRPNPAIDQSGAVGRGTSIGRVRRTDVDRRQMWSADDTAPWRVRSAVWAMPRTECGGARRKRTGGVNICPARTSTRIPILNSLCSDAWYLR